MKKVLLIVICFIVMFITGCTSNVIPKSEYSINEQAEMDNLKITLKSVSKLENNELELVFEIENNRKDTITITADEFFKLYDINKVQIPNTYEESSTVIKKNEKRNVTLNYKVSDKKLYEIYFYSGMVDNNIKFSFTDSDIN